MKIAIIGSGIAGNVVARRLHRHHEVTVFEAAEHIGGHTHTHAVEIDGEHQQIDTGFIVFNDWTYPNFIGLLDELGKVRSAPVRNEELERAHRYLIGNYEIALQTNSAIAENMTFNELYGLGYLEARRYPDRIRAVGIEDVQRVAERFLHIETRAEAVAGPATSGAGASLNGDGRKKHVNGKDIEKK